MRSQNLIKHVISLLVLAFLLILVAGTGSGPDPKDLKRDRDAADAFQERMIKDEIEDEKAAAKKKEEKTSFYVDGPPEEIFTNTNIDGVQNGGVSPSFSLMKPTMIAMVKTYHWNNALGKAPGTIGLKDKNGKSYGPWKASSEPGQGGVKSAYWKVAPNIELPAGIYTITDSDPSTWAQNKESKGEGMVWVFAAIKKED